MFQNKFDKIANYRNNSKFKDKMWPKYKDCIQFDDSFNDQKQKSVFLSIEKSSTLTCTYENVMLQ